MHVTGAHSPALQLPPSAAAVIAARRSLQLPPCASGLWHTALSACADWEALSTHRCRWRAPPLPPGVGNEPCKRRWRLCWPSRLRLHSSQASWRLAAADLARSLGNANSLKHPACPPCAGGSPARAAAPAPAPAASPPGGLPAASLPQFILFTHDDAINGKARDLLRSILDGRQSADGCKAHATLFVMNRNTGGWARAVPAAWAVHWIAGSFLRHQLASRNWSSQRNQRWAPFLPPSADCKALKEMYSAGHEVAVHTVTHKRLAGQPREFVEAQVLDGRRQLADCGIAEAGIAGFRAPFLSVDPQLRRVLLDGGFRYDRCGVGEVVCVLSAGSASRSRQDLTRNAAWGHGPLPPRMPLTGVRSW